MVRQIQAAVPVAEQGASTGNQNAKKQKDKNKGDNITFVSPAPDITNQAAPTTKPKKMRGTSSKYLAAKIKKKRPDIAAAAERGEFPACRRRRRRRASCTCGFNQEGIPLGST